MNRIVIYTAVYGEQDTLYPIKKTVPGVDYVCFTDHQLSAPGWRIVHQSGMHPDACRSAKVYKVLSHEYFPSHAYSLWVDASHVPVVDPHVLINRYLSGGDMAFFGHPTRICSYEEAMQCLIAGMDDPALIQTQMRRYWSEGFPLNAGLISGGIILRRHTPPVAAFNEAWWKEIASGSRRDQLCANYCLWRQSLFYAVLPGNIYSNLFFAYHGHNGKKLPTQWIDALAPIQPLPFRLFNADECWSRMPQPLDEAVAWMNSNDTSLLPA